MKESGTMTRSKAVDVSKKPFSLDKIGNSIQIGEIILFAVFIGTLATVLKGYAYGFSDQYEHLPILFRQLDSSYLNNDFFVNSSTDFGPRFYYARIIAALGSFCPLPTLFLLLTWLSNVLVAFVTYLAARDLFSGSNLTAMIACSMIMTLSSFSLGKLGVGHQLFSNYLIPSHLARPFALLSLWAGIKQRPLTCAFLAVLASIFQPLEGVITGAIALATIGVAVLFGLDKNDQHEHQKPSRELRKVVAGALILGAFTFCLWILPDQVTGNSTSIESSQFVDILAYFRLPHTTIPSSFDKRNYLKFLCFLIAFAVSWKWWYSDVSTDKPTARRVLLSIIVVLSLLVGGYLFVEIFPSRIWASAQTFRFTLIVKWLGLIVIAGTIARCLKINGTFAQSYSGWILLIGSGLGQAFLLLWGHIVELLRLRLKSVLSQGAINLWLGFALMIASLVMVKYGYYKREFLALLISIAISFCFLLVKRRWYRLLAPVVLLCVLILAITVNRYYPVPVLSSNLDRFQPVLTLSDLKGSDLEIANYARENIDRDAIFITPPTFQRFRMVARRAIVVDFKSFPFQDWAMVEWKTRLLDCYGETESTGFPAAAEMEKNYKKITRERILSVANKYGASYAVLYAETPSEFPTEFENQTYKIVKITAQSS